MAETTVRASVTEGAEQSRVWDELLRDIDMQVGSLTHYTRAGRCSLHFERVIHATGFRIRCGAAFEWAPFYQYVQWSECVWIKLNTALYVGCKMVVLVIRLTLL